MKDERPWLIAVGAGRWQLPGIRAARAASLRVLALDGDPQAPGLALADSALVVDIRDTAAAVAAVRTAAITPAGAIAFCNEAGMLTAAGLRTAFKLPGPGVAIATALTRKDLQRERWTRAGLPCPAWLVAPDATAAGRFVETTGATCIVKPVDAAGSRGVSVVSDAKAAQLAFDHARACSRSGTVIIETFIVGREHTVETFTHRGETQVLAITAKQKVPGTANTVACELATVELAGTERAFLTRMVTEALAALGYTDGPGHTEVLRTADGTYFLVETAGRGGGFMVADGIVPQASGFDLATACALQAVGLEPPRPMPPTRRAVVLRFIPSRAGRVVGLQGFDSAHPLPGVTCEPMVEIGQELPPATSDGDRMAFILAAAETPTAALRLASRQEARIRIDVA